MNKKLLIVAMVAAVIIPIGAYAVAPYFINTTIDEPLPTSAKKAMEDKAMAEKKAMEDKAMAEKKAMEDKAMAEKKAMEDKAMAEKKAMEDKAMAEKKAMEDKAMAEKKAMEDNQPLFGTFVGVDSIHTAQGTAKVISLDDGSNVLRLEDFKSTNGPDLYVYLATDEKATDYVSLGRLKANIGNQNYEIPDGTDLSKYDSVLIWCKQFSVLFGKAELS